MKTRILTLLVILISIMFPLSAAAPINAAVLVNPLQGTVGSISYVSGLTDNTTYVIKWDGLTIESGIVPAGGSVSFNVPVAPRGPHNLTIENPSTTIVLSTSFFIRPSLGISPGSGTINTLVAIIGTGFAAFENVYLAYDTDTFTSTIHANFNGSFIAEFVVPASSRGTHLIDAFGSITSPGEVADLSFIMNPSIRISPLQGCVETLVEVVGNGFAAYESGIRVSFDSTILKSGIIADSKGSWTTSFLIPEADKGSHKVDASGTSTFLNVVPDIQFTVTASAFINPTSGYVGDSIQVYGKGFEGNESDITVTYDNIILKTVLRQIIEVTGLFRYQYRPA